MMQIRNILLECKCNYNLRISLILLCVAFLLICFFVFIGINEHNFAYNVPKRLKKIAAICLTGSAIAISSLIFQTITNNRILTPSIMGLDALYMFIQTLIVFIQNSHNLTQISNVSDFVFNIVFMILSSIALYVIVLRKVSQNIFLLVLIGMIFGSLFNSLSSFMQAMIDPNEFSILQGKMFANFNAVNLQLLLVSTLIFSVLTVFVITNTNKLDIMSLGYLQATNLGIDFHKETLIYLSIIAIFVSISTALVGPITFLGILVVNLARQLVPSYKHSVLIVVSCLITAIILVFGQLVLERIFNFDTTVSIIINFVGGLYFIYLLLKQKGDT